MAGNRITLIHIFIDHSNMWGGARGASRIREPKLEERSARISIRNLDKVLGGGRQGVSTKIVSGGIPPGMEGMWAEYQNHGYDTQRLYRGKDWKERGVDHSIIGHMWKLIAQNPDAPTILILASGDGRRNEFGTSFYEVLQEILTHQRYKSWSVHLASFDWKYPNRAGLRSPTNKRMRNLVAKSPRGKFINLFGEYKTLVFHKPWKAVP